MKNTMGDLNNHLFAQLERLGDEDLTGEKLEEELQRARAISEVAKQVIGNGSLVLQAAKYYNNGDFLDAESKKPKMLEG